MRVQPARLRDRDHLFEAFGQALVVAAAHALEPLRAAADDQMLAPRARRGVGDAGDAAEFLVEDVGEDEIGAGIGGDQFDAGG